MQHEQQILIADDPRQFADQVTRLLTDKLLWTRLAQESQAYVETYHNEAVLRDHFWHAVNSVLA